MNFDDIKFKPEDADLFGGQSLQRTEYGEAYLTIAQINALLETRIKEFESKRLAKLMLGSAQHLFAKDEE